MPKRNPKYRSMEWLKLSTLVLLFPIAAQGITDSLSAIRFQNLALEHIRQEQYDSATYYQNKSLGYYKRVDDLVGWINNFKAVGKCYRDERKDQRRAISQLYRATEDYLWRLPKNDAEWDALGWLYINIGYTYHFSFEQYDKANQFYEKARKILVDQLQQENMHTAVFIFQAMGNINSRMGDFKTAEVLLEQFKQISLDNQEFRYTAEAYSDLGILNHNMGNYAAAIKNYQAGIALPDLNYISRGLLLGNLAMTHNATEKYEQAIQFAKKAQQSFRSAISEYNFPFANTWLAGTLKLSGEIYANLAQFEAAEAQLKAAKNAFLSYHNHDKTADFADLYNSWGNLYRKWGRLDLSLQYYQKALSSIIDDFEPNDYQENPTVKQLFAEQYIMEALAGKAQTLRERYLIEKDINDLTLALSCHELIFEVEKQLRRSYRYESSKLYNIKASRERSEHAIELAILLWEATQLDSYKEKAFEFAERSKGILLLEAYRKANAVSIAGIPDSLQAKEKEFQAEIALAEKTLFNLRTANPNDTLIQEEEKNLFELRQAYTEWIYQLEKDYSQYYNLKYNFRTASVASIQSSLLTTKKGLLEYFVGSENIYVFLIKKHDFELISLPKDFPLEDWVVEMKQDIDLFQFSNYDRWQLCEGYTQKATQLHDRIIKPLYELGLPDELLIIPSGILGFLPFEVLLSATPQQICEFDQYPYLLLDHTISYGYSATLQKALNRTGKAQNDFVGFAPLFTGEGGFQALENNVTTLQNVAQLIKGKLFINGKATIDNFREHAGQYGIIHLATHAEANNDQADFSFIVFSKDHGRYDSLFVKDIYLLELDADMVVLSACEAGNGALHEGEGIISLARGFLYAGAESIITTTWSINDQSNEAIMDDFYSFLKSGSSKDHALRKAKLKHIQEGDRLSAHPAFWAAFIPIGNMQPIFGNKKWIPLSVGLLLISGLFVGFRLRPGQKEVRKV